MKLFLAALVCFSALVQIQALRWSAWFDRDNPSGSGDWETLADQNKIRAVCPLSSPIAAECRVRGSSAIFTMTSGSAPNVLAHRCSPSVGLVCKNSDQRGSMCSDYEIRYLCPSPLSVWSRWFDRDDASGTGDWENLSEQLKLGAVCPFGAKPLGAECRERGTNNVFTEFSGNPPDKLRMRCTSAGLICRNSDQPGGRMCRDYEIRYSCPANSAGPRPVGPIGGGPNNNFGPVPI
ncbi:cartilage intermediate layer protein 2 isoform X2 [Lingula anatina]|uniref:Cartilage intermediate layer protein 2 isoform X2 n=1 Tax=Lingula anatina TaxID=7574 RepID=A0A2R2MQE3_LINAN|nr:cartilage intermediate layer protein 2 isoform X2 [Lingula anatina]|eukprot:XP_023932465.1 cartilage intermediate layer protein 2 isoform X2 [Lingula anatina]